MKIRLPKYNEQIHRTPLLEAVADISKVQNRGLLCEAYLFKRLQEKNVKLLAHRYKTKMFEVDLIVYSPKNRIHLIEVKSVSHNNWIENRISYSQEKRLLNALIYIQSLYEIPVQLDCAFINRQLKINYIENFLA